MRYIKCCFLWLTILLVELLFSNVNAQVNLKMIGKVVDSKTNSPVQNAEVLFLDSCGTKLFDQTDFRGFFYFDSINPCNKFSINANRKPMNCDDGYFSFKRYFKNYDFRKGDTLLIKLSPIEFERSIPKLYFKYGEKEISWLNLNLQTWPYIKVDSMGNQYEAFIRFIEFLNCYHSYYIYIKGHCSSSELTAFGHQVSLGRANVVREYLINKGIRANRIILINDLNNTPIIDDAELNLVTEPNERRKIQVVNQYVSFNLVLR